MNGRNIKFDEGVIDDVLDCRSRGYVDNVLLSLVAHVNGAPVANLW